MDEAGIVEAIDDIIAGKNVTRSVHELNLDGHDLVPLFIERMLAKGFVATTVAMVDIGYEERMAAFLVRDSKAYFGWVFIERFTEKKSRKLFGSALRNGKGDWAIQISSRRSDEIFVRNSEKLGIEQDGNFVIE